MHLFHSILLPFLILCSISVIQKSHKNKAVKQPIKTQIIASSKSTIFESLKTKYDTLIPIFDGLFITYHPIDSIHLIELKKKYNYDSVEALFSGEKVSKESKKWGVIDSAGKVIVPIICDGAKQIFKDQGVVSVFSSSESMHTGLPRYIYTGKSYYFNTAGLLYNTESIFMLKIEAIADNHNADFVTKFGPSFYLPMEFRYKHH